MAIGSLDRAGRLEQLRMFVRCQVWSGYRSDDDVRAEVYDAVLAEERAPDRAARVTSELVDAARARLVDDSAGWPEPTSFERLQDALGDLRDHDVVVLEAVDDHWSAAEELERLAAVGQTPRGIAYFTLPDVWHAVEHGMLEVNVWHGSSANVAPGDTLLELALEILGRHGIEAALDEGRIETTLAWQRRPGAPDAG